MKIQKTLLLAALFTCGPATTALAGRNLVVNVGGQMRIELDLPLAEDVDITTPVTHGRIEMIPVAFVPGSGARFYLNSMNLSFGDFQIHRFLYGDHDFTAVGAHLRGAVSVWGTETAPRVYEFTIPAADVTLFGAALDSGDVRAGEHQPSEDVTGTIDLATNTFSARAVVRVEDEIAGQDVGGPLTITLDGTIEPASDSDGDGLPDGVDNCTFFSNPDQQPVLPLVTAPENVYACSCVVGPLGTATGVDLCDARPVALANDAPALFPVGTTTVTWSGTTVTGAVGTDLQTVRVVDRTRPVFVSVPPAIRFEECRPKNLGVAVATDDCDTNGPRVTNNAPHHWRPGVTLVTWKATDRAGNRTYATQRVTVTRCGCH